MVGWCSMGTFNDPRTMTAQLQSPPTWCGSWHELPQASPDPGSSCPRDPDQEAMDRYGVIWGSSFKIFKSNQPEIKTNIKQTYHEIMHATFLYYSPPFRVDAFACTWQEWPQILNASECIFGLLSMHRSLAASACPSRRRGWLAFEHLWLADFKLHVFIWNFWVVATSAGNAAVAFLIHCTNLGARLSHLSKAGDDIFHC